jgi:hypothetical protein
VEKKESLFGSAEFLFSVYEIERTDTTEEGTVPVPPLPLLCSVMVIQHLFRGYRIERELKRQE